MSKFQRLRNVIDIMVKDKAPEFTITKASGDQAHLMLDFLEALQRSSLKILIDNGKCTFTAEAKDKKYYLYCDEEDFTLDVIDLVRIKKNLATVK